MTNMQINIAIAEACGWTEIEAHPPDGKLWGQHPSCPDERNEFYDYPIPDYCNDLNAMHEAEKVLSRGKGYNQRKGFGLYKTALAEVCDEQHPIDATARQRAEAFLRTIGKWEEAEK